MRIAVIDGQGGGIGKAIIDRLKHEIDEDTEIIALGTNATATGVMLKAGANQGATGENAIKYNAAKVQYILGPLAILIANSMFGEFTSIMAEAVADSPAQKIVIPLNKNNIKITGVKGEPLPHYIEEMMQMIRHDLKG